MGSSINGQIVFGVDLGEDAELPWDDEKYNNDGFDGWWMDVQGYVPIHHPWTLEGEYAEGWTCDDPRFEEYSAHRAAWEEANPCPVEVESYGTGDYPIHMLVIPGYGLASSWDTTVIKPEHLVAPPQEKIDAFVELMATHGIEHDGEPAWLLSAYYS